MCTGVDASDDLHRAEHWCGSGAGEREESFALESPLISPWACGAGGLCALPVMMAQLVRLNMKGNL
jgi:hypothetical protein